MIVLIDQKVWATYAVKIVNTTKIIHIFAQKLKINNSLDQTSVLILYMLI